MVSTTVSVTELEQAVGLACRAPSYHNSQPWRWVSDRGGLQLHLDRQRIVATDHTGRQALISCGTALDHLRVAMAAAGWHANVEKFPNPNDPDHLASVDFTRMTVVTDGHRLRAAAIPTRRTDRLPFAPVVDWAGFERVLRSRIDESVALLDVLAAADRPKLAAATDLSDALRFYDSTYLATLQSWTAPAEDSDGVPYRALLSAAEDARVDIGRDFPVGGDTDRRAQVPVDRSTVLVISAYDETRRDVLGCGEMLSTVLLEATMAGLATCILTHLIEQPATSRIVEQLTGRPLAQVLVRVGRAPTDEPLPPATPRRPLADVLTYQ